MIVLKFGGTSLESAEAIERMESIVQSRLPRHPVVVVSALGKVTDNLLALGREAAAGCRQQELERFVWMKDYHSRIASTLIRQQDQGDLDQFLSSHFAELQTLLDRIEESGDFTPEAQDAVSSFGERISSRIVTMALRKSGMETAHFDSRVLIRTDKQHTQATPLLRETYANVRRALSGLHTGIVPVFGGFIGSTAEGVTTTLGRNSSNLTAVLLAAALDAEEVEIWTDVDGVFLHDPRQVCDQFPVEELAFEEALEIAHRGARVLHPGAVMLAREEDIPMWIKNSRRPQVPGTRIVSDASLLRTAHMDGYVGERAASSD
jgi:aspartate kinase